MDRTAQGASCPEDSGRAPLGAGGSREHRGTWGLRGAPHPVFWVIAVALSVIAASSVLRSDSASFSAPAFGQSVTSGGARGVFAFSGQLAKGGYGVYMVDMDAMTLWVYEYLPQKPGLRLVGARTWRYDRYLEDYNNLDPLPPEVEQLVEDQRQYRLKESESKMP